MNGSRLLVNIEQKRINRMREILFRGKSISGKWHYGSFVYGSYRKPNAPIIFDLIGKLLLDCLGVTE